LAFNVNAPGAYESPLNEALAENEYLGFSLTPQSGQPLQLRQQEVAFTIQRASFHAPRHYAIFASPSGFSTTSLALFTSPRIESGDFSSRDFRFFLPDSPTYDNLLGPIEFRLYAYGANFNHETRLTSFTITQYGGTIFSLSTAAGTGGQIFPPPGTRSLRGGETVTFVATPQPGHRFLGWQGPVAPGKGAQRVLSIQAPTSVTALFEPRPPLVMSLGMNLGGVTDWATDWTFTDWFRRIRSWRTRNADGSGGWDSNLAQQIPRDAHDWVTQVPFLPPNQPPQIVHTIMTEVQATGTIRLRWQGAGSFRIQAGGLPATWFHPTGGSGFADLTITQRNAPLALEIHATSGPDYLRHFRIESPGFHGQTDAQPFHPIYLDSLQGFSGLRFMDWQRTNASPLSTWSQRTTTASATQTRPEGVALEFIADLSNALQQDAWICIPHLADDDFVRQAARLLRDRLHPSLRVKVEYSNETWNTAGPFTQTVYVQDQGEALGLGATRWEAGQRFVARRSAQIWKIFAEEFAGPHQSRLVKVLATQGANTAVTNLRLGGLNDPAINPEQIHPDALAIAPYFGRTYSPGQITANGYPSVDEVVTTASIQDIENVRTQVRAQRVIADVQGWDLICYEGGQHFVGIQGAESNTTLTQILITANRDPRMYDRYIEYLSMLREEGVREFANFSHVGAPSQWGSWGVLETQDQALSQAHKYRALRDWQTSFPVPVQLKAWEAD
jgi:hypothetical protein